VSEFLVLVGVAVSAIVVHELAHLVAARAVGHAIFEIQIGGGPWWAFRVGDVDVRIGVVPLGGHVRTGAPTAAGFRWRSAVVAGAGVGANLALAATGALSGAPAVVGFNLLLVAANLWPGGGRRLGAASSDGRLLLDLIRHDEDAEAEQRSGWYCSAAMRARDRGELEEARHLVEEGRREAGDTRALRAVAGVVAFDQGRFDDVVDAYAPLIADQRVTVAGRAGFAADAAWAASLSGVPELSELALPWAAFAHRARPRSERRREVLALALVDAGRAPEALAVLGRVRTPAAGAVRVLALTAEGRTGEAAEVFATEVAPSAGPDAGPGPGPARGPDHPLTSRAARALADVGPAAGTTAP
jgi:hypothetical protein